MNLLIFGIALFTSVHLVSSVAPASCASLKEAIGDNAFRVAYAVLALLGIVLIVIGWRSAVPVVVYAPPPWGQSVAFFLMFIAIFLFGVSHGKSQVKRLLRHPQLIAVLLWSTAHLLANGDIRSVILFGSLGAWALVEIPLLNRRDGEWQRPPRANMRSELISAAVSVVVFLVLIALHPYIAGVSALGA